MIDNRGKRLDKHLLIEEFPDIAQQWDIENNKGIDLSVICAFSNKKYYWKCNMEHVWLTTPNSRCRQKTDCPYCSGRLPIKGENDFASLHPELVAEWDYEKNKKQPDEFKTCSAYDAFWRCSEGHSWKAKIYNRTKNKSNCPYCFGNTLIKGKNDLKTNKKQLVEEWDYEMNEKGPEEYAVNSTKKVWWRCKSGHRWNASIAGRSNGRNCPYCAGNILIKGENDLKTKNQQLVEEWDYEKNNKGPEEYAVNSNKEVWWKCKRGHGWKVSINTRNVKKTGCPYCAGRKVIVGENDLLTNYPLITNIWDFEKNDKNPDEYTCKSNNYAYFKCSEGHGWRAKISNVTVLGRRCPYCANKKIKLGENDLLSQAPEVAKEWNYERNKTGPDNYFVKSGHKVWWKCINGHEWREIIENRVRKGYKCPLCLE